MNWKGHFGKKSNNIPYKLAFRRYLDEYVPYTTAITGTSNINADHSKFIDTSAGIVYSKAQLEQINKLVLAYGKLLSMNLIEDNISINGDSSDEDDEARWIL